MSSNISPTDCHAGPFLNLIAIAGGIGSGKSTVAKIVRILGYEVYDCDLRARRLMEEEGVVRSLIDEFGQEIFDDNGQLIRPALAAIVFADPLKLEALNLITHTAVRADLTAWARQRLARTAFVETAILYQSRLDKMVGRVWEVTAPTEVRLHRVMARNALPDIDVMARIEAQDSYRPEAVHPDTSVIINDDIHPILPRIEALLNHLS